MAVDSRYARGYFNLGTAYDMIGEKPAAARAYRRAIEIEPEYAEARYSLARLYEAQGKDKEAAAEMKRYRDLVEGAASAPASPPPVESRRAAE